MGRATQREWTRISCWCGVSHTGASGLVLGGGFGWLTRVHGLSSDNVEGFTLVTADGSLLSANSKENNKDAWALRGVVATLAL